MQHSDWEFYCVTYLYRISKAKIKACHKEP